MLPSPSPHRVTISMVKHRQMAHLLFLTAAPGAGARCWVTFVVLPPAPPPSPGLSMASHNIFTATKGEAVSPVVPND